MKTQTPMNGPLGPHKQTGLDFKFYLLVFFLNPEISLSFAQRQMAYLSSTHTSCPVARRDGSPQGT